MLYYCPIEQYPERYTWQLRQWMVKAFDKANVPYQVITANDFGREDMSIKTGQVLDAGRRVNNAVYQIRDLISLLEAGRIKDSDVIYLEDFFHPGVEGLLYALHLHNVRPRIYAYLWAQSVDKFDFTYAMRPWMRHYERMMGSALDGIFVACPSLADLVKEYGLLSQAGCHVVGLPFDSEQVMSLMPGYHKRHLVGHRRADRLNQVIYSSRWDKEKCPDFFLKVVDEVLAIDQTVKFVVCTSAPELRSNDSRLLGLLNQYLQKYPNNLSLRQGLTKEDYYAELAKSKVQFNCADQDWVSFTLLEASVAGCWPVYPYFRSFPESFKDHNEFMYVKDNVKDAAWRTVHVMHPADLLPTEDDLFSTEAIKARSWIHSRFDTTWLRMLNVMMPDHVDEMRLESAARGEEIQSGLESPFDGA